MRRVLAAKPAKLVELDATRGRLLVLGLRVVPVLTLTALQCNDLSHNPYFTISNSAAVGTSSSLSNSRAEKSSVKSTFRRR